MTVVSGQIRRQLLAMPTIRGDEYWILLEEIQPNRRGFEPGDLKIDTEYQNLPARLPLRVYVSPRLRDIHAVPPYPYEDNRVQVVRYNPVRSCWEWGSKDDFREAFEAATRAGLVPPAPPPS